MKKPASKSAPTAAPAKKPSASSKVGSKTTSTAPANPAPDMSEASTAKATQTQNLVAAMPANTNKPLEIGADNAVSPPAGLTAEPESDAVTGSTLSETSANDKVGDGQMTSGRTPDFGNLDRVRVDAGGHVLTTNQGVAIADNQNSLKAGLRGPTLLEDFILREKITHFDHERIPERIVHARGSGAHGYFEAYKAIPDITKAAPFAEDGKITPVFVRFSTVAGERGSVDTPRDVRGFAVKFYSDEGNWDLVGNNIPVFFIQDAMKFPDLVHAVKPEPHHGMPQAGSAHDTFWDFISLMPESTHMIMWAMSDRGIPRSYRMMQGFGVHTYRLINAKGEATFVKFHWQPKLGTHSLVWDEATKIQGADNDFHRRDLWEAIESGEFPEWELQLQLFTQEQAEAFSFDVLDSTKLIPEELVPLTPVGRLVLNRNPDNFFAETEQVAFCVAHVIPGIDFSHDPLLAGRIHSYVDTQISRLGGPNFHEIPINAPIAPVHNNQRDGMHRQALHRGRVAYEPNSLGGGYPAQAGAATGFVTYPEPVEESKLRGKAEKFAEHYNQATLFYESQTPVEKAHIVGGLRFELSKVTVPAIRERMLASLVNVSQDLARQVAEGLGMEVPAALPRAVPAPVKPEVTNSPALSLKARPGDGGIRTRKIALLAASGVDAASLSTLQQALLDAGAVPMIVGVRLGSIVAADGSALEANASMENSPGVLFDALVLPAGEACCQALAAVGNTMEFITTQYRHGKTILALGESKALLDKAGVSAQLPSGDADPGVLLHEAGQAQAAAKAFIEAVGLHRHDVRESDPPLV